MLRTKVRAPSSGPVNALNPIVKRAAFKLDTGKGGWIRTTLAPLNDKRQARFGAVDMFMFLALVTTVVAVARVLIAR